MLQRNQYFPMQESYWLLQSAKTRDFFHSYNIA